MLLLPQGNGIIARFVMNLQATRFNARDAAKNLFRKPHDLHAVRGNDEEFFRDFRESSACTAHVLVVK